MTTEPGGVYIGRIGHKSGRGAGSCDCWCHGCEAARAGFDLRALGGRHERERIRAAVNLAEQWNSDETASYVMGRDLAAILAEPIV